MTSRAPITPPARTLADDIKMMKQVRAECAEDRAGQLAIDAYIRWMKDSASGAVLTSATAPVGKVK